MKFRNLIRQGSEHLNVFPSRIHGRGLFTARDVEAESMIIHYAGEVSSDNYDLQHLSCELLHEFWPSVYMLSIVMLCISDYSFLSV
jgi:hypothetical protein